MTPQNLTQARRRFLDIRSRGRTRYVWYFGVLRFGGFWTLLMGLVWFLLLPGYHPPFVPGAVPRLLALVLFFLPFGALGGYIYGHWMWRIFERNTRKLTDAASGDDAAA